MVALTMRNVRRDEKSGSFEEKPKSTSFSEKVKSALFSRSHVSDSINKLAEESEEE